VTLRVLIADDEPLARQRLEDLLASEPDLEIVGEASGGAEAVEKIAELRPDLVFLDVQMPGLTGMQVAETVGTEMPVTVFVTAYDQYALKAFELAAVDYLVKPFDDERFEQTLRRARELVEMRRAAMPAAEPEEFLDTIAVESRGEIRAVPVAKIDYITASGPYAELHVGEKTFLVRERMHKLEERLDPRQFFRAHRSSIVRLDRVEAILRGQGGDYGVRLKDGTELSLSRNRREPLEKLLGIA
jgi:two-component system LytT family response regulator